MEAVTLSRIVGPPGCGKTTYLSRQVRLAYEAGHEVMVCSLTRAAAVEVAGRDLPIPREAVGTLHSHAYRALRRGKIEIADDPKHLTEWNDAHPGMVLSGGRVLDEDNTAPVSTGVATEADTAYLDYNNHRARLTNRATWKQSTQGFAQAWEKWKVEQDLLDFTDLLEAALQDCDMAPGSPGVIFADEAQDFSALELALLQKWGDAAGRLVVVGDPWQSLYEWRGADAGLIFPPESVTPENTLRRSYRVPAAVRDAAMKWMERMPGYYPIVYRPTEEAGEVLPLSATYEQPERVLDVMERALADGQEVMYLASCGRMLNAVLSLLRQHGIPFHNPYRKAEGAWNPLQTRRTAAGGTAVTGAQRLAAFLRLGDEGWWTREDVQRWGPAVKGSQVFPEGNTWKRLEVMLNHLPERQPIDLGLWETLVGEAVIEASMTADLEWWLEHLLSSRRQAAEYPARIAQRGGRPALLADPKVTVGTIHSVKGGEADVVILAPDVSVPGAAEWAMSDAGKASIYRLFYVGMTRAKKSLHIMSPVRASLSVRLI